MYMILGSVSCMVCLLRSLPLLLSDPNVLSGAYHGSATDNIHSILHNGLMNFSLTRKEANGAMFGAGVYLAESLQVASSFASGAQIILFLSVFSSFLFFGGGGWFTAVFSGCDERICVYHDI